MIQFSKAFILFLTLAAALTISAQTAPAPPEQVTYFIGGVKMSSPAGQPYGSSVSLVKRTLTPAENKIVEIVLSIDAKGPPQEYTTVFAVKDSKFTIRDEEKTFEGEGEFTGKPWSWTGWKYQVNMLGARKGTLKAEDTLTETGITVKKAFYSPDGRLRVNFSEDLKPIGKEMYDLLHAKLMVK
jgi:hypothetical protein